jgi:hypothetical protein
LRFRNTTGNWIAVVLIADGENLWSRIVGTDPGWEIEVSEPEITNRVEADPRMYSTDSPELPRGQDLVVETAWRGSTSPSRGPSSTAGSRSTPTPSRPRSRRPRNLTLRGSGPVDMPSPFA